MTQIIRYCPDCGRARVFAQHHGVPGRCPDAIDGSCPEWYCHACGAAFLIAAVPLQFESATQYGIRDRVA